MNGVLQEISVQNVLKAMNGLKVKNNVFLIIVILDCILILIWENANNVLWGALIVFLKLSALNAKINITFHKAYVPLALIIASNVNKLTNVLNV